MRELNTLLCDNYIYNNITRDLDDCLVTRTQFKNPEHYILNKRYGNKYLIKYKDITVGEIEVNSENIIQNIVIYPHAMYMEIENNLMLFYIDTALKVSYDLI